MLERIREYQSLRRADDAVMQLLRRTVDQLVDPTGRLQLMVALGTYEYTEQLEPKKPYGQITSDQERAALAAQLIKAVKQRFALYQLNAEITTPINPQIGMKGWEVSTDAQAETHTVRREESLILHLRITVNRWHWFVWKVRRRIWLWRERRIMIW